MSIFSLSAPPFNWCHLKLTRAREHVDTLNNEITAWVDTNPGHVAHECSIDATRYSVKLRITNPPPLERWSLVTADLFHNLRTVLDQFIYAVAVYQSRTDPPPNGNALHFPIFDTPAAFKNRSGRIKFLSAPVRAVLERVQPYNRRHSVLPPLLALLRDFDNTDKHRLLQLVLMRATKGGFDGISGLSLSQLKHMFIHTGSVEDGTEIAAIVLNRSTPNVYYDNFRPTLSVAVCHAPGPKGHTMTGLKEVVSFISGEINAVMLEIYKVL